jgi:hypothetical protein
MPFIPDDELEQRANRMLSRWEACEKSPLQPPVPVQLIAEVLLDLRFDWDVIADTDATPILAYVNPATRTIKMNEARRSHFETFFGTEAYTVAHEVGHWDLHVDASPYTQQSFSLEDEPKVQVHMPLMHCERSSRDKQHDRYEIQADKYASYLLMPKHLLLAALRGRDVCRWPTIYALRDMFEVSTTAMVKRLEALGLIYVAGGSIYPSKAHYDGQAALF